MDIPARFPLRRYSRRGFQRQTGIRCPGALLRPLFRLIRGVHEFFAEQHAGILLQMRPGDERHRLGEVRQRVSAALQADRHRNPRRGADDADVFFRMKRGAVLEDFVDVFGE